MSNAPIGVTAMMLGTFLTGYLDRTGFEKFADDFIADQKLAILGIPRDDEEELAEFYSSLVVLIITGLWSYALSMYVNAAPSKGKGDPSKKEL